MYLFETFRKVIYLQRQKANQWLAVGGDWEHIYSREYFWVIEMSLIWITVIFAQLKVYWKSLNCTLSEWMLWYANYISSTELFKKPWRDLPGSPAAKTTSSQSRGPGFDPLGIRTHLPQLRVSMTQLKFLLAKTKRKKKTKKKIPGATTKTSAAKKGKRPMEASSRNNIFSRD